MELYILLKFKCKIVILTNTEFKAIYVKNASNLSSHIYSKNPWNKFPSNTNESFTTRSL